MESRLERRGNEHPAKADLGPLNFHARALRYCPELQGRRTSSMLEFDPGAAVALGANRGDSALRWMYGVRAP
jgi:hypothetical protein